MRLGNLRRSRNVEDRRGRRGTALGGVGIVGVLFALVVSYFTGINPLALLDMTGSQQTAGQAPPADDPKAQFVAKVLGSTEDVWAAVFAQAGERYRDPTLVLFSGSTSTACGVGKQAMGPFYCPLDSKVYIDLSFYQELSNRFQAPGEFAQAYVIAHEVGHHVQNLLGVSQRVQQARAAAGSEAQANALSVRLELQADCLAGVWANRADRSQRILEPGDVEQAITAAAAIGDDQLQRRSRGYVVPDSFTHGSSQQRVDWFRRGMGSGNPDDCDTFQALR